jgi:hypothetical protein
LAGAVFIGKPPQSHELVAAMAGLLHPGPVAAQSAVDSAR